MNLHLTRAIFTVAILFGLDNSYQCCVVGLIIPLELVTNGLHGLSKDSREECEVESPESDAQSFEIEEDENKLLEPKENLLTTPKDSGRFPTLFGRLRKGDESGLRITRKKSMIQQPDEDEAQRYSRNANSFITWLTTSLGRIPLKVTPMSKLSHYQRTRRGDSSGLRVTRGDKLGLRLTRGGKMGVRITKKGVADAVSTPFLFN